MAVIAPTTASRVLKVAASQLGVHEDPPYSNKTPYTRWYGLTGPWCAMFVSWVLHQAGFPVVVTSKKGFAYCPDGVNFFKKHNAWADRSVKPKPGWIVFFDFPGDGVNRVSHVGIVEGVLADGRIATLEGNTNGAGSRTGGNMMRHNRSVAGGIVGYGMITYEGSTEPTVQEDDMKIIDVTAKGNADFGKSFFYEADKPLKRIPDDNYRKELLRLFPGIPVIPMDNGVIWDFVKSDKPWV